MWTVWDGWAGSDTSITTRERYRSCTSPAPANGGAYCSDQPMEQEQCPSATPVCYAAGVCGCEKVNGAGTKERGIGVTQGSCASSQTCYSNGACRGKFRCRIYLFVSTCIILAL